MKYFFYGFCFRSDGRNTMGVAMELCARLVGSFVKRNDKSARAIVLFEGIFVNYIEYVLFMTRDNIGLSNFLPAPN